LYHRNFRNEISYELIAKKLDDSKYKRSKHRMKFFVDEYAIREMGGHERKMKL
jgi:hypothetical protein